MQVENFVEIVPIALSQGISMKSAFILLLQQKGGTRCLPLLVSEEEQFLLSRAMQHGEFPTLEPMMKLVRLFRLDVECVILTMNRQGTFKALTILQMEDRKRLLEYSPVTGILVAMLTGCRLFISHHFFNSRFTSDAGDPNVALPLAMMTENLLHEALQMAVKSENFELAQVLNEELKKRDDQKNSVEQEPES